MTTTSALSGKKAPANTRKTVARAPQDMKGTKNNVILRSVSLSIVRQAIIAGTLQPKPIEHGHEALARHAEGSHRAVHDEGGARHVAHVFQKREEEEEHADLRQEGKHRAHAAADAVDHQAVEPGVGHEQGLEPRGDRVHELLGEPLPAHARLGTGSSPKAESPRKSSENVQWNMKNITSRNRGMPR